MRLLILIFLIPACSMGSILPAGFMPAGTNWFAGVRGGIPNRTTVYTNLYTTNTAADISYAVQHCPSNQVVQLSAGIYYLSQQINFGDFLGTGTHITLRGSQSNGTNATFLNWTNAVWFDSPFKMEGLDAYGDGYVEGVNSNNYVLGLYAGYTQGSTNLTLSAPQNAGLIGTHSELKAGTVFCIDQLNDYFINIVGNDGSFSTNASALRELGTRAQQQYAMVLSISNGTNLTIWPPIYATNWQSSLSPQIWWWGQSLEQCGIENLNVNLTNCAHTYPVMFWSCRECWVKNVEIDYAKNAVVYTYDALACEVRDSYFNKSQDYGSGSYGVEFLLTSASLCENNIFDTITTPMMTAQGASGCVFGYNFCTNGIYYSVTNAWNPASIEPHYVHNYMNLFEGNKGTGVEMDFTHGSASHNTLFRNRFYGSENTTIRYNNTFAIQLQATNWWTSIVGNVLGTTGWHTNYSISTDHPETGAGLDNNNSRSIYKFGFVNDSGATVYGDTNCQFTALIHGNWDSSTLTNGGIVWSANIADHIIPNSYYLNNSPSWWGTNRWPAIDPTNTVPTAPIPAQLRYAGISSGGGGSPASSQTVLGWGKYGWMKIGN